MMFGYGMAGLGFLMMLLFGGLVIGLFVWLVMVLLRGAAAPPSQIAGTTPLQQPLDIAQQRYAGGEITKAEYEEIRNGLSGA